jgi:hypothetical protein
MAYTNFPYGVRSYGIPLIGSGPLFTTGDVYFVSADIGASTYAGTDPARPMATIDQAINKATAVGTASVGEDIVIVQAGHTENIAAAAAFDLDKAGVQVIGLGKGSLRPTLTSTATDGDVDLNAAGIGLYNLLFVGGIDSTKEFLDVTSATGLVVEACEFRDATNIGVVDSVILDNSADVKILNNRWYETDAGVGQSCLLGTTPTRLWIEGNHFYKDAQTGVIELGNVVDIFVYNNWMETAAPEDLGFVVGTTGTGWLDNIWIRLADNAANITEAITGSIDLQMGYNLNIVNADNEMPYRVNATGDLRGTDAFATSTDA